MKAIVRANLMEMILCTCFQPLKSDTSNYVLKSEYMKILILFSCSGLIYICFLIMSQYYSPSRKLLVASRLSSLRAQYKELV
jgi:hypothetical protein